MLIYVGVFIIDVYTNKPPDEIMFLITWATSKGSAKTKITCSLTTAFAICTRSMTQAKNRTFSPTGCLHIHV